MAVEFADSLCPKASTIESDEYADMPKVVSVQNIRITPGYMHFENAYEGKSYKQKLVIQNCGKNLAFIILDRPNSATFEYDAFERGLFLSSGMKIVRTVKATYSSAMGTLKGHASIFINNEEVIYKFLITLTKSILVIEPQIIDFGQMDAVNHTTTRTFSIRNEGLKATNFAIDLGRNPLEMNVYPMKGMVYAKTTVIVSIEIVGSEGGNFVEEFWIKTIPPKRIIVKGVFVSPKLIVKKFINSLDFTLVEFPPTYYGSSNTEMLLVKNYSPSNSMFCVMAEVNNVTMTLKEARKIDENYKNFDIMPLDGRLKANRGSLIQITFSPVKTKLNSRDYSIGFFKIIRLDCHELMPTCNISDSLVNDHSKEEFIGEDITDVFFPQNSLEEHFSFEHSIKICVYGEKEDAYVEMKPTMIHLNELTLGHVYQRTVLIKNESKKLSLKLKYRKVCCVEVKPSEFDLQPNKSVELLISIRTNRLGHIDRKIIFDLLSDYKSIAKNSLRKVGTATLQIHLEVSEDAKKTRLDQCKLCTSDLAEKLEWEFPYKLSEQEMKKKIENDTYYINYVRRLGKNRPSKTKCEDYAISNSKLINLECQDLISNGDEKSSEMKFSFIPLAPRYLYNIKITPKSIRLRKVSEYTTISDFFEITNLNKFPVRVFIKPSKPCLQPDNNARYVIQSQEKKKITFNFTTTKVGRYYVNISVLINDSVLYEVTAVANAVPKTLNIDVSELNFDEKNENYKFVRLTNPFNAATTFAWDIPFGSFQVYPTHGSIQGEKSILCLISFDLNLAEPYVSECILTSESGQTKLVKLVYTKGHPFVSFDSQDIDFGSIPLNMSRKKRIILKNLKTCKVAYRIRNHEPIPGVSIEPFSGTIDGLDSQVLVISVLLKAVISFDLKIIVLIDEEMEMIVNLSGNVEYPSVDLSPKTLIFKKIAPFSIDSQILKVVNLSNCECSLTLATFETCDFTITASEDELDASVDTIVLQRNESRSLYIHFHPHFVSTHSLNLNYVINDILGPVGAYGSDRDTLRYHLQDTSLYEKLENVRIKAIPRTLKMIRITSSAVEKKIKFSKLKMNFLYFGQDHYNNATSKEFVLTNISNETVAVCIRTDNLAEIFSLVAKSDGVEHYKVSYKIVLNSGEKVTFVANFHPASLGKYKIKLPIFLNNYYNNKIFNFLTMTGVYASPTIVCSTKRLDFEPIPLSVMNEINLTLKLENHFDDCEILTSREKKLIHLIFENDQKPHRGSCSLNVTVILSSRRRNSLDEDLEIRCKCGSVCTIPVTGVTENCLLTTHVFSHFLEDEFTKRDNGSQINRRFWWSVYLRPRRMGMMKNTNSTSYPLFPTNDDCSDYANYMRELQKTLENWIFSQAFYKKYYHKIPEGFTYYCRKDRNRNHGRLSSLQGSELVVEPPLLQLVVNFTGTHIRNEINECPPDTNDELTWLLYISRVNSKILYHLRGYPLFLPHVKSKYLLSYDQYVLHEKIANSKSGLLDEITFYRFSKQCWIDLILQMIKTFILFNTIPRAKEKSVSDRNVSETSSIVSYYRVENNIVYCGIYGSNEIFLLMWLETFYNQEREILWESPPGQKKAIYLDEYLRDGLVLATLTAHFCPYVKHEFQEMYTNPKTIEEFHHNACILIKTWSMLNLSYIIKPIQILTSAMVEMLLLVTYLYNVLPNFLPKEEIRIKAKLTQNHYACIDLENLGQVPIHYKLIFFGNENNLFTVFDTNVMINSFSKKTVKVHYHAKNVTPKITTLLFSGETPGHKYAKSLAVTLEGVADVSYVCAEIPIISELYKLRRFKIPVESPFKFEANYSVSMAFDGPNLKKTKLFTMNDIKSLKKIKEFLLEDDIFNFDENGFMELHVRMCLQKIAPYHIWIYFTNPDVGDWGVKVICKGLVKKDSFENIPIAIPKNYENFICRCKNKISVDNNCPKILQVRIPKINNLLWHARKIIILDSISGQELRFWTKHLYLDTSSGARVLKLMMNAEKHPTSKFLEDTVEYMIDVVKPCPFITLPKITIDDVVSENNFILPIHPVKSISPIGTINWSMKLKSVDKSETRYYRLHLINEKEIEKI